ncbi:3-hydroxyacyl-ACP dehydratase FabZ [bacterium]|nr:3-hydroxyacyl-ACP dehydratase FabZ [candidate division CSSED10-310 bacterium]
MPQLNITDIQRYIFHRYPFLLVDRVLDYDPGRSGVGIKNVTHNEPFFQGHFPGQPVMPGVLMIEALAQLAAVVLAVSFEKESSEDSRVMGYFAAVKNFKFKQTVVPGDQLRLSIEFTGKKHRIYSATGKVEIVGGKLAAEGDLMFALMNLADKN